MELASSLHATHTIPLEWLPLIPLDLILQELKPNEIEMIKSTNSRIYTLIRKQRHHYRKKGVNILILKKEEDNNNWEVQVTSLENKEYSRVISSEEEFLYFVHSISPAWLVIHDNDQVFKIHREWWKMIHKVEIIFENPNLGRYTSILNNCTDVRIEYPFQFDINCIIRDMPAVHVLKISKANGIGGSFNNKSLELLSHKSRNGLGIKSIVIQHNSESGVDIASLLNFFKNAKFCTSLSWNKIRNQIDIERVFGSRTEMLQHMFHDADVIAFSDNSRNIVVSFSNYELHFYATEFTVI